MSQINVDTIANVSGTSAMTINSSGHVNLNKNVIECWLLDKTDTSVASGTVLTPWERDPRIKVASRNAGITESSGLFTFPHDGLYKVSFTINGYGGAHNFIGGSIDFSTDSGSNFTAYRLFYTNTGSSGQHYTASADIIFDVTASTHRVRVRSVGATATVKGAQTSEAASTFLIFDQIG